MNDERMSDHDEETKSRLRWTEASRLAGEHAFLAPSRVDSTSRAGAYGLVVVLVELVVVVI